MMKEIIIGLLVIGLMICAGCLDNNADDKNQIGSTSIVPPIDYGNGILYFDCVEAQFGNSLSEYLEHNSSIEVVAVSGNGNAAYGRNSGYFVVVKEWES